MKQWSGTIPAPGWCAGGVASLWPGGRAALKRPTGICGLARTRAAHTLLPSGGGSALLSPRPSQRAHRARTHPIREHEAIAHQMHAPLVGTFVRGKHRARGGCPSPRMTHACRARRQVSHGAVRSHARSAPSFSKNSPRGGHSWIGWLVAKSSGGWVGGWVGGRRVQVSGARRKTGRRRAQSTSPCALQDRGAPLCARSDAQQVV